MKTKIYRGLVVDEPFTWVYGSLINKNLIYQSQEPKYGCCGVGTFIVYPESVGEYTHFRDSHYIKIYEQDVVKNNIDNNYYKVVRKNDVFYLADEEDYIELTDELTLFLEIVGNSFEKEN